LRTADRMGESGRKHVSHREDARRSRDCLPTQRLRSVRCCPIPMCLSAVDRSSPSTNHRLCALQTETPDPHSGRPGVPNPSRQASLFRARRDRLAVFVQQPHRAEAERAGRRLDHSPVAHDDPHGPSALYAPFDWAAVVVGRTSKATTGMMTIDPEYNRACSGSWFGVDTVRHRSTCRPESGRQASGTWARFGGM
jgi:hypothetical protein